MSSVAHSDDSDPQSLACPRCNSHETKFCYYNNYSTAQPRHFCKNCKRYWTAGGSLRNVPVGGGLRKSKKSKLSKHGRDLLFASPGEILHPGRPVCSFPFASPSSSTDAVVDENITNLAPPLLAYRPTFEFTVQNDLSGDFRPASPLHSPCHMSLAHISDNHRCGSSPSGNCLLSDDKCNDRRHPQTCYGGIDRDQGSHDWKSYELSQGQISQEIVLSNKNKGYSTTDSRREYERSDIKGYAGVLTSAEEAKSPMKQRTLQCSVDDLRFLAHDGAFRKAFAAEDEDESLGDVINEGYPYDWEQVFEVLIEGTPDFFQLPTF